MLTKAKTLDGYKLHGVDGEIGKVKEFYFDDQYWTIRYLVVDTGNWLVGRLVLISPYALKSVNKEKKYISINLTKQQIEKSPSHNSNKPVSRHFEEDYHGYYNWPRYWGGPYMWGSHSHIEPDLKQHKDFIIDKKSWDSHLRSTDDVSGHHIEATDGNIGHVEDFIIDDETWAIRYLIVDTQNFWPGKLVLVSPQWIERISWPEKKIFINLSCESIKESPEYTEAFLLDRDYETGLYKHYNRKSYWTKESVSEKTILL